MGTTVPRFRIANATRVLDINLTKISVCTPSACSEFWGMASRVPWGWRNSYGKTEILAGWVTKICLNCKKKLGKGGRVTFDNIFKSSRDVKQ